MSFAMDVLSFTMDVLSFTGLFIFSQTFANEVNGVAMTTSSDKADIGVDFTFTCVTNAKFVVFLRGTKNECTITGNHSNGTCIFNGKYNTGYVYHCNNNTGVYKLTIPSSFDIDTLHGSNWTCNLPLAIISSKPLYLYVIVPITQVIITTEPTDKNPIEIIDGNEQIIICRTNAGRPSSRIQWFKSGINISDSSVPQAEVCNNCNGKYISSSKLTYTGMKKDDGKTIYCTAGNVEGKIVRSENRSIDLLFGPSNITIFPLTETYTVNESTGSVGPVSCLPHGCRPDCIVKWSGPYIFDDSSSELELKRIKRNMTGYYFCTASNEAGSKTSVNISVIVNYGPTQINIIPLEKYYTVAETTGHVGPINCSADCKPACIMTWIGPTIPVGTLSLLHIQNINKNQAGKYQCNASNMIGSQISETVHVVVNYGPDEVNILPNTLIYTVTEPTGYVGPITCTADCNPNCSMTWTGPNMHGGALSVLHLQDIDRNQSGSYLCTASNNYGKNTSSTVRVIVYYGPRKVIILPMEQNYIAIESIDNVGPINCTADCNPECTMKWNGPNLPKSITSVLYLENINKTQAGYYTCNALNSVSSLTSAQVSVIVNYGPAIVDISPQKQFYIVNETDAVTNITCTADCNPSCLLTWTGPNLTTKLSGRASSMLNIPNIARNQSGTYQCNASNIVGSQISLHINVTVNFRPAVYNIFGNRSFNENDTAVFSCNVESVPASQITWYFWEQFIGNTNVVFVHNIWTPNRNVQVNALNISQIGCLSMGTYTCAASNIIGKDTKRIDIDVKCSPRINSIEYNVTSLIAVKDQEPLNITIPIIAYPEPYIFWTFDNNVTSANVTQKTSNSAINNRAFSSLYLENVTEKDFGQYYVYAGNGIGSTEDYIYSVEVIPKRKPNPPNNVTCIGRSNSILVYWISNFNGGDTQLFKILVKKDGGANFYDNGQNYKDPGRNLYLTATIQQLTPQTTYHLTVHAVNEHNFTESELTICNTTSADVSGTEKSNIVAIAAGTGIGGAVVVLIIVAGVFIFIRRRKVDDKIGQDKELMQRVADSEDKNADELKENPLYDSSQHEPEGTVYSVVNKKRQIIGKEKGKATDESAVYSDVVKIQKKDKKNKEMKMGCVNRSQTEDVYANSEVTGNFGDKQVYTPTKNKDGLIYADLDLVPNMSGNRFVIRGLENRNNYAVIDLTKTAEPLPLDSDSDNDDKAKKNTEKK